MSSIPVGIISGFLGAGKTSLLNNILHGDHGLRIAVLVNDFGAINIDAQLVTAVSGETISLANGCVCCTIRDDLVKAIEQLLERNPQPEHILVETSGVSEPAAAAMGIASSSALSGRAHLDAIITVVDAAEVLSLSDSQRALAMDQIEPAHLIFLNKTDLVSAEHQHTVREWLRNQAPAARIVDCQFGNVSFDLVIGIHGSQHKAKGAGTPILEEHKHNHDHATLFDVWSWNSDQPLEFESVYRFFRELPREIIRGKGLLYLRQVPGKRVVLQMVGPRVTLKPDRPWDQEPPGSQIVLIGERDSFDSDALSEDLRACAERLLDAPPNPLADAVINILRKP